MIIIIRNRKETTKNTKDDKTMSQRKFMGIFVKRTGQNTVKSGMSMLRKEQ